MTKSPDYFMGQKIMVIQQEVDYNYTKYENIKRNLRLLKTSLERSTTFNTRNK